jgi:hypothetical protein
LVNAWKVATQTEPLEAVTIAGLFGVLPVAKGTGPSVAAAGQLGSTPTWYSAPPANVATGVPFSSVVAARFPTPTVWLSSDPDTRLQAEPVGLVAVNTSASK